MKLKSNIFAAGLVALSCSIASAQSLSGSVSLNWKNLATGDQSPLLPGQAAAIWVDVAFGPAVGTQISTPLGTGTVAGLSQVSFSLIGSGNPGGSWRNSGSGFGGTPNIDGPNTNNNWNNFGRRTDSAGGWALGGLGGQGGGALGGTIHDYLASDAGQFPLGAANPINPVREISRLEWTPSDYSARTVSWQSISGHLSGTGLSILVLLPNQTHTSVNIPAGEINWGSVHIPVPAPSTLALLGAGALIAARRRRA